MTEAISTRAHWLVARINSEGYCCLNGYLRLCQAHGEKPLDMAENIGVSRHTIYYHYRKLESENPPRCLNRGDCMREVIEEIEEDAVLHREKHPIEKSARGSD